MVLADALDLEPAARRHLLYLAKITAGACVGPRTPAPVSREVSPAVLDTMSALDPRPAMVTNHLGDVLAYTDAFAQLFVDVGLLDEARPNLTRWVFTDPRAKELLPNWCAVADEQAFNLWLGPSVEAVEWFVGQFVDAAGEELMERRRRQRIPQRGVWAIRQGDGSETFWARQIFLVEGDNPQQLVVFSVASDGTSRRED